MKCWPKLVQPVENGYHKIPDATGCYTVVEHVKEKRLSWNSGVHGHWTNVSYIKASVCMVDGMGKTKCEQEKKIYVCQFPDLIHSLNVCFLQNCTTSQGEECKHGSLRTGQETERKHFPLMLGLAGNPRDNDIAMLT